MLHDSRPSRDSLRCIDLCRVALTVAEAERMHGEALALRNREHGSRIEPTAEEEDGGRSS
jgi:hypothetical protein